VPASTRRADQAQASASIASSGLAGRGAAATVATGLGSQRIAFQPERAFVETGFAAMLEGDPGWRPSARLCDPLAVHRSAVGLVTGSRPTMRQLLLPLPIPRTFIRGDRGEALAAPETLEASGVRIVTIRDAGHVMMADAPEAFIAALAAALP
jgi:pimeloyl-ACP methyl ester carboxylesterase